MKAKKLVRNCLAAAIRTVARWPLVRRVLNNLWFEHGLCMALLPDRMTLPKISITELFPGAEQREVVITHVPGGAWRTPLNDVVYLLKVIRSVQPSRVLELGSYKGWTATYMINHMGPDGRLVTVDANEWHGEAYRDTPLESRIDRRVGMITNDMFPEEEKESYDLIFVDADHRYEGVQRDTNIAMQLVSRDGLIIWHDYANFGYFNGYCQVPEYLSMLAKTHRILHILDSNLAIYSPVWEQQSPEGGSR